MVVRSVSDGDALAAELLLGSRWAPITNRLSFINLPLEDAAGIWREWEESRDYEGKEGVVTSAHHGGLEDLLGTLLPLGSVTRVLFLETANPNWTLAVENSSRSPDLHSVLTVQYGQKRKIRSVIVTEIPHTLEKKTRQDQYRGCYGARKLQVVGPGGFARTVAVINEDKWVFISNGDPFDFENTAAYGRPRKAERFTHEMLVDYCRHLGLDAFNESFYVPNGRAILVESIVSYPVKEYTLAEARAGNEDRDVPRT